MRNTFSGWLSAKAGRLLSSIDYRKQGAVLFRKFFATLLRLGVDKEKDEANQKYIVQMNLIGIVTFIINAFTGCLFFCIQEPHPALLCILSACVWLSPLYFNRNGLHILSRVLGVFYTAGAIVFGSCLFSHDTLLDNYLLVVAVNCNFMYSHREKNWQLASIGLCLLLYVIESSTLQQYLPAYNKIKNVEETNIILLIGLILNIIVDVLVYAYVNRLRENNLLAKQCELEEVQKQLQTQHEDVKAFSIAASHNMQTPLHVSSFFIKKIAASLADAPPSDTKQQVEIIANGLQQIEQLVSGLFAYNRILNIENEWELFDVNKEMSLVKKNLLTRYETAVITIDQRELYIRTNRMLFSIIIHNLVDNGIKYNKSARPEVRVSFASNGKMASIFIRDNGIGIPLQQFDKVFSPFNRIQTDVLQRPGNGLGLAGARRAAERIGGELTCFFQR